MRFYITSKAAAIVVAAIAAFWGIYAPETHGYGWLIFSHSAWL
jgi:hypothetical protein